MDGVPYTVYAEGFDQLRSRDSSVGIATGYGLEGNVPVPAGARDFSLLHSVQTGTAAHPASYPMDTGGPYPREV
jgi:hypothetical protein